MVNESPSLTMVPPAVNWRLSRSTATDSAPATHGFPMPRATTAACEVRPPRDVSTPCAAIIPCTSSGLVSIRTRITDSPSFAIASARSASNTALPYAAPGEAASPVASTSTFADGSMRRCSS